MNSRNLKPSDQLEMIADNIRTGNKAGEITALGACVFAGGFSFGLEEAGLKVCGHFELTDLELGAETSAAKWPVLVAPLEKGYEPNSAFPTDPTTWQSAITYLKDNDAIPRVMFCNPPCAAFAKNGARGGMDDNDNMCYSRYVTYQLCMKIQPEVWMWELVPGIFEDTKDGGRDFLDKMAEEAQANGYEVHYFLTSAAHHGGYQNRPRFHFVASKVGLDWAGTYKEDGDEHKGWKTLGECLDKLEQYIAENGPVPNHEGERISGGALLDIIPFCPPGGYLRDVKDELMEKHYRPRGQPWNGQSRAGVTQLRGRRDRTSPVIIGGHTVIHPEKNRFLTIRESAAVMGFPYDYQFSHGSKGYAEVGKGLCTHNARFLGLTVKTGIELQEAGNGITVDTTKVHVVDWRGQVKVPSQSSTDEERIEWFKKRHPELDPQLGLARPKRGPGRPKGGSSRRGRRGRGGPKTVLIIGDNEELQETLEKMEFNVEMDDLDNIEMDDLPEVLGKAGRSHCIVVRGPSWDTQEFMVLGACLAQGTRLVLYNFAGLPEGVPDHASITVSGKNKTTAVAPIIAQALGMSAEDVLSKMMEGQDAASLLAKLLEAW